MDLLKIIYEHDITLESLSGEHSSGGSGQSDAIKTLEQFLKPQKTWNRYYFSGTKLPEKRFGLTCLRTREALLKKLDRITGMEKWHDVDGKLYDSLWGALQPADSYTHHLLISGKNSDPQILTALSTVQTTDIRSFLRPLTHLMDQGHRLIISEKAHHGMDLHLFSSVNFHEAFFHTFQKLIGPELRCFSMNGKRLRSEKQFYFETWALENPPHGCMEITHESRLRN